jgi:5-hydroxyisourate hydrolase
VQPHVREQPNPDGAGRVNLAEGPQISTHVLDTEKGSPAMGVVVELYRVDGDLETLVGGGTTDDDGRIRGLLFEALETATYRIAFQIDGTFFRQASVTFAVDDPSRSYHVPLLLAPYSLSTYRGS